MRGVAADARLKPGAVDVCMLEKRLPLDLSSSAFENWISIGADI
jgi:hypothetical protein